MKTGKCRKLLALALGLILCLGLCVPALATNLTAAAAADPSAITASDAAQTVTVTVTLSEAVQVTAYSANVSIPEGWSTKGSKVNATISNCKGTGAAGTIEANYSNGKIANTLINNYGEDENEFAFLTGFTIAYTVPANAAAGDKTVGLTALEITNQTGTVVLTGADATTTVTVNGSTPSTGDVSFTVAADKTTVAPGDDVTVTLTLNTDDVLAAGVLQFAASDGANSLSVKSIVIPNSIPGGKNEDNGKISFGNNGGSGAANLPADTLIATVTFATTDSTPEGLYTVSVTVPDGEHLHSADNTVLTPYFGTAATFTVAAVQTYTVTYKVVNGTWFDGTTADKTETVASGASPASVPTGMIAADGYTGGAWDTNPANATITGATTFTYTFDAVPTYTVTYKVVNGTWSDGTIADMTENVASGASPASVPTGMIAANGYTGGAWDTDPANATITGATTFTYTFERKGDVDGDGDLDMEDAQLLFNYLVGKDVANFNETAADVSGDGTVNSADIVPMLNLISRLTP